MTWTWKDLALFTVATWGLAWLVTRARVTRSLRERVRDVPFLGELLQCIVCTGTWIGAGLALLLPWTTLVAPGLRARTALDLVLLVGWNTFFLWVVARFTGDAD